MIRVIDGTPLLTSHRIFRGHHAGLVRPQWPPSSANFPYGFQAEITDSLGSKCGLDIAAAAFRS